MKTYYDEPEMVVITVEHIEIFTDMLSASRDNEQGYGGLIGGKY